MLLRLLATTGMRLSEAFSIDSEATEKGCRFVIVGRKTKQSLRRVPLPAAMLPFLPRIIKGPLFTSKYKDPVDAASKRLNQFLDDCGIVDPRKVIHSLRHRAQDRLRAAGCPEDIAIDGSKFKAVNTRDKNFTRNKVERRRAQLEESVARYLAQLDTADRQEPSEELASKTAHLQEKLVKLESEIQRLAVMEKLMLASPDQQISLTDPDSRSMATSGRGSGVVGYNAQVAVDTKHHLIIAHEVTNDGSDRAQLAKIACQAKQVLGVDKLEAVADRGYYSGDEILQCHKADIAVTLPKPMTSGIEARGRFGKQDFVYLSDEDVYRCPAGEKLKYRYTNEERDQQLRRYWTTACRDCALKPRCTTGKERRITRWEHEQVLEAVQKRLDKNPQAMRVVARRSSIPLAR